MATAPAAVGSAGLTSADAAARLARDGPNELPAARQVPAWRLLVAQLTHFFALLLWVAAVLALVGGMPELAVAIVVVVVVNGLFAFAQEHRADHAAQQLRRLMPETVVVRRDGRRQRVMAREVVAGDVVLLSAGDRISADLEILVAHALAIDESTLTGESVPARRQAGERAWLGTYVVEGEAETVVVAIGAATRLAGLATMTQDVRRRPSPLAVQLERVVKVVAVCAVGTGTAFFVVVVVLGGSPRDGFLLAVGVTVALVPEGLLPTVTLSLARGAQRMARVHALVRRLDAVEALGSTTFVCSDKTGTLTRNEMSVVQVWTPAGLVDVTGTGYDPAGTLDGSPQAVHAVRVLATSAVAASNGRVHQVEGNWRPHGDPLEVALHVLALRAGAPIESGPDVARFPFDPRRRRMSVLRDSVLHVKGAPHAVLAGCRPRAAAAAEPAVDAMAARGLRVLAVARRTVPRTVEAPGTELEEADLELLGIVGVEDLPREGVTDAVAACRRAGVRLAMVTGDDVRTALAIAREVGLHVDGAPVVVGKDLPSDVQALADLVDRDGAVLARIEPEQKLLIARALRARGHVVAMTGDGVNDGPALREADIGVAMGRSGTDVAREAADLVLLDDHFATIVAAIELGRATFSGIRRFLTYHLTDNVAELTPFVVWALSGGSFPLALSVLQVLALDIGTDLLPALALGAEPPSARTLAKPPGSRRLVDGALLRRVFGVLGPTEAMAEMAAFTAVLVVGGWVWGATPEPDLLAVASGTAFASVVLSQMANAYACRSETRWVGIVGVRGNPLLAGAVVAELLTLAAFLWVPLLSDTLGGSPPDAVGWLWAFAGVPAVLLADAAQKQWRALRSRR